MNKLGKYVLTRRNQLGWSRAELARQSGVPHTTIRNIENNPHNVKPQEETLEALAAALQEDDSRMLKLLAGYATVINGDVSTFAQRVDTLRKRSPRWEKVLNKIIDMEPDEEGQALTALEIHAEQVERRKRGRTS